MLRMRLTPGRRDKTVASEGCIDRVVRVERSTDADAKTGSFLRDKWRDDRGEADTSEGRSVMNERDRQRSWAKTNGHTIVQKGNLGRGNSSQKSENQQRLLKHTESISLRYRCLYAA